MKVQIKADKKNGGFVVNNSGVRIYSPASPGNFSRMWMVTDFIRTPKTSKFSSKDEAFAFAKELYIALSEKEA